MSVKHLVLISFKEEINHEQKETMASDFIKLGELCLLDGKKYIQSITGGKDNSKEGLNKGYEVRIDNTISYAFVLKFSSIKDRDFYCDIDSAHSSFKDHLGPIVKEVLVVDFEEGVF